MEFVLNPENEAPEFTLYCDHRKFSAKVRRKYASTGVAMPDGSYPIPDRDALRRAIASFGHKPTAAVKRHIMSRARSLGLTSMLPPKWTGKKKAVHQEFDDSDPANDGDHDFWNPDGSPTAKCIELIKKICPEAWPMKPGGKFWTDNCQPSTELQGKLKAHIQLCRDRGEDPCAAPAASGPTTQEATLIQEGPEPLRNFVTLEKGDIPGVTILQEPDRGSHGAMRMRVPFYVGGSTSRAAGFNKKILWQEKTLPKTIAAMKAVIQEGKQPLTVYGRHAHALTRDHLPTGGVVDVEQEGRIGYAILEVEPTTDGRDIQILAQGKKLNAVSLRAEVGHFKLRAERVNGEEMLVCEELLPDGIDFAPDGPAQPTYGIELLNEAPRIEPLEPTPEPIISKETVLDNLTLERLRLERADLVAEVERPLAEKINSLKEDRKTLRERVVTLEQERDEARKDAYVAQVGATLTQDQRTALTEFASTVKTREEVGMKVAEILVQAHVAQAAVTQEGEASLTPAQKLAATLFPASGAGQPVVQEGRPEPVNTDVLANLPELS